MYHLTLLCWLRSGDQIGCPNTACQQPAHGKGLARVALEELDSKRPESLDHRGLHGGGSGHHDPEPSAKLFLERGADDLLAPVFEQKPLERGGFDLAFFDRSSNR